MMHQPPQRAIMVACAGDEANPADGSGVDNI